MRAERATLSLGVLVLVASGLLPLLAVVWSSLGVDGRLSLVFYERLLTSEREWRLLGNSLLLASSVATAATLVGLPLGVLLARTDLPFRRALALAMAFPLFLSPYILAVAWFQVLGRGGLVGTWFGASAAERTHAWLFGLPGCVLVLTSCLAPVVLLLTIAFLRTVYPRLEEAGRCAARPARVLIGITVASILPGVLLGTLVVFLLTLGEFGVPMFLRYDVYAAESFTRYAASYQPEAATAAAVPLALIAFIALLVERLALRDRTYEVRLAAGGLALTITLGRYRWLVLAAVAAPLALMIAVPFGALAASSLAEGAYVEAVRRAWDALLRSLAYAAAGATALTLLGFQIGYLVQRRALPVWRSVDTLAVVLFALPSTVMGIGLVTVWNRPWAGAVYGTPLLVLVGYLAQYTALSSRVVVAGLAGIPRSMEDAARVVGAGWFRRAGRIVAPLAGKALGAAWVLTYLFCLRDTGLTMMVYPPGGDTLPVRTFTLMANGAPPMISALCVLMIGAALTPLLPLSLLLRGRSWRGPDHVTA